MFVTGGNSMALNFKERLETELLAIRPFLSKFKVTLSSKEFLISMFLCVITNPA